MVALFWLIVGCVIAWNWPFTGVDEWLALFT